MRRYRGIRFGADEEKAKRSRNLFIQASTDLTYAAKYLVKAVDYYTKARIAIDSGDYKKTLEAIELGLSQYGNAKRLLQDNQFVRKSQEVIGLLDDLTRK